MLGVARIPTKEEKWWKPISLQYQMTGYLSDTWDAHLLSQFIPETEAYDGIIIFVLQMS